MSFQLQVFSQLLTLFICLTPKSAQRACHSIQRATRTIQNISIMKADFAFVSFWNSYNVIFLKISLARKEVIWIDFIFWRVKTYKWMNLFILPSLENRICSMTVLFFSIDQNKTFQRRQISVFWSLSIETSFGVYVCTVDCLRPPTEKYSGNILSLMCS